MIVVPDAGPLIYLGGAEQLALIHRLFARVVVPRVVYDEVVVAGAGLVGSSEVAAASWLEIVDVEPDRALSATLDVCEAAAIPLAERLGATLLCDDFGARAIARGRGVPVIGTLGVLLRAKRENHLLAVEPVLERMKALGMFVAPALEEHVLKAAGER